MNRETMEIIANEFLAAVSDEFKKYEIVGSIRREKENCNDVDVVCIPRTQATGDINTFLSVLPEGAKIVGEGYKAYRIKYKGNQIDIYASDDKTYEVRKLLKTGPLEFTKKLIATAKEKGWELKEDGLYGEKFKELCHACKKEAVKKDDKTICGNEACEDFELKIETLKVPELMERTEKRIIIKLLGEYIEPKDRV